ncbi:MAG: HIT family protein [Candidatus Doudnabacteria bacterium]|nr:HIT family protein [Candidatus Doudnabacteria bacterium]
MDNCIFCKIINKEIPSSLIYEDDQALAFLSIRPISKGHTLVIPKVHSKDLLSTDEKDLVSTIVVVKKIAQAIVKATGAAGFNLGVNNGAHAGQEIFHLHFHIIPRYSNDGLKPWPHLESEPKTGEDMAEEIKKFL